LPDELAADREAEDGSTELGNVLGAYDESWEVTEVEAGVLPPSVGIGVPVQA
jgi:hypothetical protein